MKSFNTTAVCVPSKHYMVDLTARVHEIRKMVDEGKYFTINRARQYGKTTTLLALRKELQSDYVVVSISFESISDSGFSSEDSFVKAFCRLLKSNPAFYQNIPEKTREELDSFLARTDGRVALDELFISLNWWCGISEKPIVMLVDEVDSATNNQVFLDFLAQLRAGFISRETDDLPTFQSVILAGVTDVKHLKAKIRPEDTHRQNSPWNIAADFDIDMSLPEDGIRGMLEEYEADHHTGMDTAKMARLIREYTSGYPFLVSRICQLIDMEYSGGAKALDAWSRTGLDEAIKKLLAEDNTLFQSLTKNLNDAPDLKASLRRVLMNGERLPYNMQQDAIARLQMYGFIRNDHNTVRVSNRIFETLLYNLFLSDEDLKNSPFNRMGDLDRNHFVENGRLNMRRILDRFIVTYTEICGPLEDRFKEKDGRELFLLYLRPIINGTGNYYIEAQTRDQTRTDVIVDYLGQQYIIELKIWRGERYNAAGEKQISEYLEYFGLNMGYMLSFNFNRKKEPGVKRVEIGDKVLFEGTL